MKYKNSGDWSLPGFVCPVTTGPDPMAEICDAYTSYAARRTL